MSRAPETSWHPLTEPLSIVAGPQVREAVALWMLQRLPQVTELPGGFECIGVARGNELVGACAFTDYRPCHGGGSITMWAVGHNWLSRRVVKTMFGYAFGQLNCHRVTVLIARGNKASRKLVEALGFREEGKIRRGFDLKSDLMLYGLLKDEQKWV